MENRQQTLHLHNIIILILIQGNKCDKYRVACSVGGIDIIFFKILHARFRAKY